MLRLRNSHFLSSLVIGGFGFLLLSGCAQTFTGNLSELVSEPARQKDFVENQPFTERDDVKIDPLAFETTTTTSPDPIIQYHAESNPVEEDIELTSLPELATTPEFEPVQYPEQTITAYSDIHEKPSMPEVEHTDVPPPSVIQLLPMSPAPKTSEPIALLLPQSSPLTQQPMPTPTEATQLVEPQMIEPPTTELPTLTATAQYGELDDSVVIELPEVALTPATTTMIWPSDDAPNFNASEGTASAMSIPDASEVLTGAQLLPSFQSTNQFQLSEPSAPGGLESEQSDSESTAAVENTIDFVSDQMQVMVPPFADPPAEECDSCPTTNPASQSDSNNQFVGFDQDFEQANELESPNTSDFIESLIASSMDPTAIETLASATESTPPDTSEAVVETPVGWNEQLAKTIEIFEAEASSANADQRHRLEQSLRILQSLKTSMQDSPTQLDSAESNDLKQYWEHQLNALNAIMSNSVDEDQFGAAATEALKHLRIAASRLRNSADLFSNHHVSVAKWSGSANTKRSRNLSSLRISKSWCTANWKTLRRCSKRPRASQISKPKSAARSGSPMRKATWFKQRTTQWSPTMRETFATISSCICQFASEIFLPAATNCRSKYEISGVERRRNLANR